MALRLRIYPLDARAIGALRAALGVAMITRPSLVPRLLGVDRVTAERMTWLTRLAAGREIALGFGAVTARGPGARRWVAAGAFCDLVDAWTLATAVRRRHINRVLGTGAIGTSVIAAAGGIAALARPAPPTADG